LLQEQVDQGTLQRARLGQTHKQLLAAVVVAEDLQQLQQMPLAVVVVLRWVYF
jgi:hypothetical protein